jgi:PAS domain S-box-containing protein
MKIENIPENRYLNQEKILSDENLFINILENVNSGVALIDDKGKFLLYNNKFLSLFGLAEESTIRNVNDQNWSEWHVFNENLELLHVDDHPVRKAAITGKSVRNQLCGVRLPSGGDIIWMLISAEPIFNDIGIIEKTICTYTDITEHKLADIALRKSEQRYRQLFNSMTEMFQVIELIHDENGRASDYYYRDVNPAFEKLVGLSRETLVNRRVKELFPDVKDNWFELYDEVYKTGNSVRFENFGDILKKEFEIYAWKTLENNIAVILTDVTESKKTQKDLMVRDQRLKYHFENSPLAVIEWDTEYKVTRWSNEAARIFGWGKDEVIGKDISSLNIVFEPDLPILSQTIERLSSGRERTVVSSNRNYTKNREVIECNWYNSVLTDSDGVMISVLSLVEDVTDRKKAERDLIENEKRLKELNATKDKLFSIIAHDLKSPFTSIIGFSELLIEKINKNDQEGIGEFARVIHSSSWKAMGLLTNLIEWSRAQTGRMEFNPEEINLTRVINEAVNLLTETAARKEITISVDSPPELKAFAYTPMISTILRNLLSNAIKFTNPGGNIIVSCKNTENEVLVIVNDNGVGIEDEILQKLFHIENSLSTPGTGGEEGTGLGLLICYEFVMKHGGRIWVDSIPGISTSFSFTLPFNS